MIDKKHIVFRLLSTYHLPFALFSCSGHGGRVRDTSGDEDDGYDETLIPVDFRRAGQIVDDDIYKMLVTAMPADVNVTVLVRCLF